MHSFHFWRMVLSGNFWRMALLWTLALVSSYLNLLLDACFPSRHCSRSRSYHRCGFSPAPNSPIKRPVCVITGATSGLGAAAARVLAGEGYHIVIAGRCSQRVHQVVQDFKQQSKNAYVDGFYVDLSSFDSIKKFTSSIKQWLMDSNMHPSIQLLINNAGILASSCRVTNDGYDQMMETNYISAFFLTILLLPLLKASPVPSRIVNVTSFTHQCVSAVDLNEETLEIKELGYLPNVGIYPSAWIYELSKVYLLLFSYELHRQLCSVDQSPRVSVIAADPGVVKTNIMRELPPFLAQLAFLVLRIMRLLQPPETGVTSIIDAALAPPDVSGEYFFGGKGRTIRSSKLSYNAPLGKKLWSNSMMLFEKAKLS